MSVLNFLRFLRDMALALGYEIQFRYYAIAMRHCGESHPDAWLIARRMMLARLNANDILRRHVK